MKKYVMEAVGAMLLLLTVSLIGNPIATGMALVALVYMGGHISGGHYNPAISLGAWINGKLKTKEFGYYVLSQLIGGFVASIFYFLLIGKRYFAAPGVGVGYWKVMLLEMIFTFFLVFVALTFAMAPKLKTSQMYGLAIGFTLLAISFLGGTYNPMVSISSSLFDGCFLGTSIQHMPAYALGSFGGGAVAAYFYKYIYS